MRPSDPKPWVPPRFTRTRAQSNPARHAQSVVLAHLRTLDAPATVRAIGAATGLDLSTINNALVDLERQKLATREPNPAFKRQQNKSSAFVWSAKCPS